MRRTRLVSLAAGAMVSMLLLAPVNTRSREVDPLVSMLSLRLAGDPASAAEIGERRRTRHPDESTARGVDLALAATYEQQGRAHEAFEAWQRALTSSTPTFASFATAQTARLHLQLGQPESAAKLARRGLDGSPPWGASVLLTLVAASERSGDCTSLAPDPGWKLSTADRRRLALATARCRISEDLAGAVRDLTALLLSDHEDLVASEAADTLWSHRAQLDTAALRSLTTTLHRHRMFDRSTELLAAMVAERDSVEHRYRLARGYFWLEDYARAADEFERSAALAQRTTDRARGWYHRGRSLELAGNREAAAVAFRRAYDAAPTGGRASASLLSTLRLEVLGGQDDEAARLYRVLVSRAGWRKMADRGALFLAVSDIARGREDRARSWLSRSATAEFTYWKGRLAELQGDPGAAIDFYLQLTDDPDHPLAQSAHSRLRAGLAEQADARAQALAGGGVRDLLGAVMLRGGAERAATQSRLQAAAATAVGDLWNLQPTPVPAWPTWLADLTGDAVLLRLGVVASDSDVSRWFRLDEPALAIAGIDLLYLNGRYRSGLRTAEILTRKLQPRLRPAARLKPEWLERRLYPRPFGASIEDSAADHGVDPDLLLGLIRQESRFDPLAVSPVSARGLTQFVVATAEQAAVRAGISDLTPSMLHQPPIAIRLGAAHIGELAEALGDSTPAVLAAYNAGLPQARLWADYCFSDDPAEYYSKIGFTQTRDYVAKVVSNQARYRAIYGDAGSGPT